MQIRMFLLHFALEGFLILKRKIIATEGRQRGGSVQNNKHLSTAPCFNLAI